MLTKSRLLLLPMIVLAMLVAACGGTATTPSPTVSASASATPSPVTPSPEPTESEEPETDAPETDEPSGSGPDLEAAAEALEGIDSYRLVIEVEGAQSATIEAVIIRGDEPAAHYTTTAAGQSAEIIVIGDEAWTGAGGVYQSVPVSVVSGMTSAFDPALMVQQINQPGVSGALESVGVEEKNGVQATHYHIDADSPGVAGASFPPGATFDLWIAEAGYLVSLEAAGMDPSMSLLRIDISDVNSDDNVVERPA